MNDKLAKLWQFAKDRFSERSSALGAIQIVIAVTGLSLPDVQQQAIAGFLVAVVGLISVFVPDKPKEEK